MVSGAVLTNKKKIELLSLVLNLRERVNLSGAAVSLCESPVITHTLCLDVLATILRHLSSLPLLTYRNIEVHIEFMVDISEANWLLWGLISICSEPYFSNLLGVMGP